MPTRSMLFGILSAMLLAGCTSFMDKIVERRVANMSPEEARFFSGLPKVGDISILPDGWDIELSNGTTCRSDEGAEVTLTSRPYHLFSRKVKELFDVSYHALRLPPSNDHCPQFMRRVHIVPNTFDAFSKERLEFLFEMIDDEDFEESLPGGDETGPIS